MPTSPTLEDLAQAAERLNRSPPLAHAGVRVFFPSLDLVVAEVPEVRAEHRGGLGTDAVNGGVLAAVFDLVTGCTALLVDPRRPSATVQLSMSFERPVLGNSFRAEGRIDTQGRRTLFASARILDARGQLCARCQAVVALARSGARPVAP
ncbi:MAG: PaaI family thioesterase [Myxococcaceae bacterium]